MKNQYHIIIKPQYFSDLTPTWMTLPPEERRRIRRDVIEGIEIALKMGKNIFSTSEHIIIRPLVARTGKLRVIRSIPAVFK